MDRFFQGTEIAHIDDVATLAARIVHNWKQLHDGGYARMLDSDAAAVQDALSLCARKLPELEGIKDQGWNVYLAEAVDPEGDYASDRHARLVAMREWLSWTVSHFGTTRMSLKAAANVMYQGQGKQITVDRHQMKNENGTTTDYFQFSFDHGNRMYSDYMRLLFNEGEIL